MDQMKRRLCRDEQEAQYRPQRAQHARQTRSSRPSVHEPRDVLGLERCHLGTVQIVYDRINKYVK
jgi:hypothetical protein